LKSWGVKERPFFDVAAYMAHVYTRYAFHSSVNYYRYVHAYVDLTCTEFPGDY